MPIRAISEQLQLASALAPLAAAKARRNGGQGAVLVFVAGVGDIEDVMVELSARAECVCVPLHGEMELEEQLEAFQPVDAPLVKVVVATNAAESSLTLPDVDVVIDCGQHKVLSHGDGIGGAPGGPTLMRRWISRASAEQRAGRTGRVRPGVVYRLYPREWIEAATGADGETEEADIRFTLRAHEPSDLQTQPLDGAVLKLRATLDDGCDVRDLMMEVIDPPPATAVEHAVSSLANLGMLDPLARGGRLTFLGTFSAGLPLEPRHARMLALSITLGLAAEGCVLAAVLSLQRTPFRDVRRGITRLDADAANALRRKVVLCAVRLDGGRYCEPLQLLALHAEYESMLLARSGGIATGARATRLKQARALRERRPVPKAWCDQRGLVPARVQELDACVCSIRRHVALRLKLAPEDLSSSIFVPAADLLSTGSERPMEEQANLIRVLLLAANHELMLRASLPTPLASVPLDGSLRPQLLSEVQLSAAQAGFVSHARLSTLLPAPIKWSMATMQTAAVTVIPSQDAPRGEQESRSVIQRAARSKKRSTSGGAALPALVADSDLATSIEGTVSLLPPCIIGLLGLG